MNLRSLIAPLETKEVSGALEGHVTGIAWDSRRVRPGNLFFALQGQRCDGATFADEAAARGAAAIVYEGGAVCSGLSVPVIQVASARSAMAEVARTYYGDPSSRLRIVGVTGTNGKTSITWMLRQLLQRSGESAGLIGTIQYEIGERRIPAARTTPEAPELQAMLAEMLHAGCGTAVMEVSSHGLVQRRVEGISFDVAVFTNLSPEHLDYHQTMEAYFQAKGLLFKQLGRHGKSGSAVVNVDNQWGRKLLEHLPRGITLVTYGTGAAALVRAEDIRQEANGCSFFCHTPWGNGRVSVAQPGLFSVRNALAAISSACVLGLAFEQAARGVALAEAAPGRIEQFTMLSGARVFVDYAHTPDALEQVLTALRPLAVGRLVVVFGCGGDRDKAKRKLMGQVAAAGADYSILTSDNPRTEEPLAIIEQIRAGYIDTSSYEVEADRRTAIERALDRAEPGDIVLIAGKGHENYQQLRDTVVSFDDREVVRQRVNAS